MPTADDDDEAMDLTTPPAVPPAVSDGQGWRWRDRPEPNGAELTRLARIAESRRHAERLWDTICDNLRRAHAKPE